MATPTNYTYSISLDCPDSAVNPGKLQAAIQASDISIAIDYISTDGGLAVNGQVSTSGTITIFFKDVLPTADRVILDGNNGSGGVNTGAPSGTHPALGLIASTDNSQTLNSSGEAGVAALGSFAGRIPAASGRSYGYLPTSSTSNLTIRGTTYTPQTNAAQRSVGSSDAADTLAGAGAQKVKITYYNNLVEGPFTEIVDMNGTTPVNTTATDIAFIEEMQVVQVGANGGNTGTIFLYIGLAGAGGAYASIAPEDNITYWCHHYVPPDMHCYITMIAGSATAVAGRFSLQYVNPIAGQTAPQISPDAVIRYSTYETSRAYNMPIHIEGPAIVFLNGKADSTTASTTFATFHWVHFAA